MSPPVGPEEPGAQNAMVDLDPRILRIAEAIGRHIAREDMARRSNSGSDQFANHDASTRVSLEPDIDDPVNSSGIGEE